MVLIGAMLYSEEAIATTTVTTAAATATRQEEMYRNLVDTIRGFFDNCDLFLTQFLLVISLLD